jgi:hypothetical protein
LQAFQLSKCLNGQHFQLFKFSYFYITIYQYIHVDIHAYIHTCIHPYIHISNVYIYTHIYIYIFIYILVCTSPLHTSIYPYMIISIHAYIHISIYIYICIYYPYTYVSTFLISAREHARVADATPLSSVQLSCGACGPRRSAACPQRPNKTSCPSAGLASFLEI